MTPHTIQRIQIWPVDIPMDPFVVATGTRVTAQNLFIRVTLHDGARHRGGSGLSGSRRRRSTDLPAAATNLARTMIGQSAADYESLADRLTELSRSSLPPAADWKPPYSMPIADHKACRCGGCGEQPTSVTIKPISLSRSAVWRRPWPCHAPGMVEGSACLR